MLALITAAVSALTWRNHDTSTGGGVWIDHGTKFLERSATSRCMGRSGFAFVSTSYTALGGGYEMHDEACLTFHRHALASGHIEGPFMFVIRRD